MKRFFKTVLLLCLLLTAAKAEEEIPSPVCRLYEKAYPGYAVIAVDGYDDGENGQWALVLEKDGDNVLVFAEKEKNGSYALTLNNPNAVPDEGDGYSKETHTIRVMLEKENRNDRQAFFEMAIEQPDVSKWVITSELETDGVTWGNVISEYTTYDWNGRTVWWSHVFAEDDSLNYMRHQEDLQGKPLFTANYPRVPVGGESAAAHLLECFDAGAYPYTPDGMNGLRIAEYAEEYVPDGSALVQIDLQEDALILLVESAEGERTLRILPHRNWQFKPAIVSNPLPGNASLDLFHAEEGTLQIEWFDGEHVFQMGFHSEEYSWKLSWLMIDSMSYRFTYNSVACVEEMTSIGRNDGVHYGEHPWTSLAKIDFKSLPMTLHEALASLDQSSYAVVNNPNPEDRLHLRELPRKDARSFGKFYNRTPVKVHEIDGEWAYVSVGSISGYMMTRYLAFGKTMDSVACAFPQEILQEGIDKIELRRYKNNGTPAVISRDTAFYIVGVEEENYVILTEQGWTGYVPQSKFYPGNG